MGIGLPEQGACWNACFPTPLVPVRLVLDLPRIRCKLEFLNPSGSTKDRIARFILEKAWRQGQLGSKDTVVEASSDSTSITMAQVSASSVMASVSTPPRRPWGLPERRRT